MWFCQPERGPDYYAQSEEKAVEALARSPKDSARWLPMTSIGRGKPDGAALFGGFYPDAVTDVTCELH